MTPARRDALLIGASGVLLGVAQPLAPHGALWFGGWNGLLALVALVPWWLSMREARAGRAAALTFGATAIGFLVAQYWTLTAMHVYGGLSIATSVALLVLLVAMESSFFAGAAALAAGARDRARLPPALTTPVLWGAAEWARGLVPFGGFPWSSVGSALWRVTPLAQVDELVGLAGLSAIVVCVNAAIGETIARDPRARRRAGVAAAFVIASIGFGALRIAQVTRDAPSRATLRVALVQGNVAQDVKHDPAWATRIRRLYAAQIEAWQPDADLVVLPEASLPGGVHLRSVALDAADLPPGGNTSWLLAGAATWWDEDDARRAFNSAILVAPGNAIAERYHKRHLVPFGEYVPLEALLGFAKPLTHEVGHFLAGEDPTPLAMPRARLGVLICYEDAFSAPARAERRAGADLIVEISNDAWYGRSSAAWQHLAMSVFRAIESRRAVVRATQDGVSASIDAAGRVGATLGEGAGPTALLVDAPIGGPRALFPGDAFGALCALLSLAAAALSVRRR